MPRSLRKGAVIRDYRLTTDMTTRSAGSSVWAFAERDGQEYFLKQYLNPIWPGDDSPYAPEDRWRLRAECKMFEEKMASVQGALGAEAAGGFLIGLEDFFRVGSTYYGVTEKIEVADDVNVAELPASDQLLVLTVTAYALKVLHQPKLGKKLVHADLKRDNIILQAHGHRIVAKVIDFDAAFFEPAPPSVGGDQAYMAPETVLYARASGRAPKPTQAADVFAVGIVFCEYLSGSRPPVPSESTLGEVMLKDSYRLVVPAPRRPELRVAVPLIERMLARRPADRPTMAQVHGELLALSTAVAPPRPTARSGGLRFGGVRIVSPSPPPTAASAPPPSGSKSRLRIRGLKGPE